MTAYQTIINRKGGDLQNGQEVQREKEVLLETALTEEAKWKEFAGSYMGRELLTKLHVTIETLQSNIDKLLWTGSGNTVSLRQAELATLRNIVKLVNTGKYSE